MARRTLPLPLTLTLTLALTLTHTQAAFGETAQVSDASAADADEGGDGYEIVGTF